MVSDKVEKYGPVLEELQDIGVDYTPLVWSSWGRPHEDAVATLQSMAESGARRRGGLDAKALASRTASLIGVQIWKRAARMFSVCAPPMADADTQALLDAAVLSACQVSGKVDDWGCSDGSESGETK